MRTGVVQRRLLPLLRLLSSGGSREVVFSPFSLQVTGSRGAEEALHGYRRSVSADFNLF